MAAEASAPADAPHPILQPPTPSTTTTRSAPIRDIIKAEFDDCETAEEFADVRARLRQLGGAPALLRELEALGVVEDGALKSSSTPSQEETDKLGEYASRFYVCRNR